MFLRDYRADRAQGMREQRLLFSVFPATAARPEILHT